MDDSLLSKAQLAAALVAALGLGLSSHKEANEMQYPYTQEHMEDLKNHLEEKDHAFVLSILSGSGSDAERQKIFDSFVEYVGADHPLVEDMQNCFNLACGLSGLKK